MNGDDDAFGFSPPSESSAAEDDSTNQARDLLNQAQLDAAIAWAQKELQEDVNPDHITQDQLSRLFESVKKQELALKELRITLARMRVPEDLRPIVEKGIEAAENEKHMKARLTALKSFMWDEPAKEQRQSAAYLISVLVNCYEVSTLYYPAAIQDTRQLIESVPQQEVLAQSPNEIAKAVTDAMGFKNAFKSNEDKALELLRQHPNRKWSNGEMADVLGINRSTVGRWKRYRRAVLELGRKRRG